MLISQSGPSGTIIVTLCSLHAAVQDDDERDRGVVLTRLGRDREAAAALQRYLELVPDAPDTARVQLLLDQLKAGS